MIQSILQMKKKQRELTISDQMRKFKSFAPYRMTAQSVRARNREVNL